MTLPTGFPTLAELRAVHPDSKVRRCDRCARWMVQGVCAHRCEHGSLCRCHPQRPVEREPECPQCRLQAGPAAEVA